MWRRGMFNVGLLTWRRLRISNILSMSIPPGHSSVIADASTLRPLRLPQAPGRLNLKGDRFPLPHLPGRLKLKCPATQLRSKVNRITAIAARHVVMAFIVVQGLESV